MAAGNRSRIKPLHLGGGSLLTSLPASEQAQGIAGAAEAPAAVGGGQDDAGAAAMRACRLAATHLLQGQPAGAWAALDEAAAWRAEFVSLATASGQFWPILVPRMP